MKSVVAFVLLIVWTGYLSLIYNDIIYVTFFFFEIFLFISALIQAVILKKRLLVEFRCPLPVADAGKSVPCEVTISNRSAVPLINALIKVEYINVFNGKKTRIKRHCYVPPHGSSVQLFDIISDKCGVVNIRVRRLAISDAAGLIRFYPKVRIQSDIIFLPRLIDMDMEVDGTLYTFRGDSNEFDKNKPGEDPSEVFQIREYREGDRIQNVHWKASVKNDAVMVKEYSKPLSCALLVLADLREESITDDFITLLLSYSAMLIEKNCHHYVAWYDCKIENMARIAIHSMEDVYVLMNEIMRIRPSADKKELETLYRSVFPYDAYMKAYVFSTDLIMREGGALLWNGKDFLKDWSKEQ